MEQSTFDLQPRGVLDLLDTTVRVYRRNFADLLGISAVVLVPTSVLAIIFNFFLTLSMHNMPQGDMPTLQTFEPTTGIIALVAGVLSLVVATVGLPLSDGALAHAISEHYLGRRIGVAEAYRRALPYWGSLILVAIIFGLLMMIGPITLGVAGAFVGVAAGASGPPPVAFGLATLGWLGGALLGAPIALLMWTWFTLYTQAMVLERVRGFTSLQRARELVRNYGWHVFGTLILMGIGLWLVSLVLGGPIQVALLWVNLSHPDAYPVAVLIGQTLQQTLAVLLGPCFMILQTLLYYDLRIRKEGFDLQMMAEAIHPGEGLAPPRAPATILPPFTMPTAPEAPPTSPAPPTLLPPAPPPEEPPSPTQ